MDHNKLWKILKEMGIPDHLTCLLRNLYAGQESQLELDSEQQTGSKLERSMTRHILSPCLFNFYAEYIMQNAGLGEAQAGIKIAGKNINKLRYADDICLVVESEEELKRLLMKVKENNGKNWLKTQHSEN